MKDRIQSCYLDFNNLRRIDSSVTQEVFHLFDRINDALYKISGCMVDLYTPENIDLHVKNILGILHAFKTIGFVTQGFLERNPIWVEIGCLYKEVQDTELKDSLFEVEHVNNLILLMLYKDLVILEETFKPDAQDDLYFDLMVKKDELLRQVSGGLRQKLKQQRIGFHSRLYTGFDTEFKTLEYGKNKLLAFTTSTFSRFIFRIKHFSINFSTNVEGKQVLLSPPLVGNVIRFVIFYIRFYKKHDDLLTDNLLKYLNEDSCLDKCTSSEETLFFIKKPISPTNFTNAFHDLRDLNSEDYSLSRLIFISKENSKTNLEIEKELFLSILSRQVDISTTETTIKINNCLVRKGMTNLYLVAHFSVADIASLSDFNDFKSKLQVIGKTYVTLGRSIPYEKVSLHIRDTSLLSVGGSSLKEISNLYTEVDKIDIGDNIKEMDVFMNQNLDDFKAYAIQDSVIALFHLLRIEETVRIELRSFFIPITLASFAGNFIKSRLNMTRYKLPVDPVITKTSLQEVYTPVGIDSNPIASYLHYFIGSLHGGRNESFIYGICKGIFFDYDLPGAYPTAMSLIAYPDYKKGRFIYRMKGEDLIKSKHLPNILQSFTSLNVKFEFPSSCGYPNLPVRLDDSTIIFPLSGISNCTGVEFVLAMELGCTIVVESGYYIPF